MIQKKESDHLFCSVWLDIVVICFCLLAPGINRSRKEVQGAAEGNGFAPGSSESLLLLLLAIHWWWEKIGPDACQISDMKMEKKLQHSFPFSDPKMEMNY
jgi:hypothetical protein